jgi:membrane dipeptidase
VIASHSNAYEICPVSRNLHPHQINAVLSLGGVIGLNLYRRFLSDGDSPSRQDVLRHTEYFLEHGCEDALCFGCDMDGADLPDDLGDLSAIPSLREFLSRYYSEEILNKLFFKNAYSFAADHLTSSAKNL